VEFLKRDKGLFRFYASPQTRYENVFLRVDGRTYGEALAEAKDKLCANRMMEYKLYDAWGYESLKLMNYTKFEHLIDSYGLAACGRLLDLLNVKYIATMREVDVKGYTLVNRGVAYLYENENVLPRAFLVPRYVVLKNERDIANRLKSAEFLPGEEVILEEGPELGHHVTASQGHRSGEDGHGQEETVTITKYAANEVVIDLVAASPKFLVLSDQFYPGWKAFVDGERTRLYKADFVLRAVYVENPGHHTVRFVYDPFSFKVGLVVSLVTVITTGLILFVRRRKS
jgi:hypothetical protein